MIINFTPGHFLSPTLAFLGIVILLSGCNQSNRVAGETTSPTDSRLQVIATTTILADVVNNIGGDHIRLDTLLPVGVDPHSFQASPQDLSRLAQAEIIFINGAGLEEFILPLIENANPSASLVDASGGIAFLTPATVETDEPRQEADPHVWTDPNQVMIWARNITQALVEIDPQNTAAYQANAENYVRSLNELDTWIQEQVSLVPPERRKLVTDHQTLEYFAERYGFDQVGAILPGVSTLTEPTAQELATLEDAIQSLGVKAIFVGTTVNPALARQVANDTGTRLVSIYTGSLSESGGPADTYLDYIRHNVNAITEALK